MSDCNNISIMQLNLTGISAAKQTLLNKYFNDLKPDFVALNETKRALPHDYFNNYRTFSQHQNTYSGGVSLSLPIEVSCCEISSFQRTTFDSVWCLVHMQNLSFILSTAYVPPNAEEEVGDFILSLDEARQYCTANKLSGVIFVGDINARSSFWGDTRNNKCGDILEAYVEEADALVLDEGEPTFYAVNGKSVIDLTIITDKLTDLCYTKYTDTQTELLTGYPSRGHVPVFSVFKIPNSSPTHIRMKYDLGKTDWKEWKTILEEKMIQWANSEAPIYDDVYTAWDKIRDTLQETNREHIPKKIITKHCKPFWTKTLTELSLQLRTLRKVFKRTSTPANMVALNRARIKFKSELRDAASNWTHSRLNEINKQRHGNQFWKELRKVFPSQKDDMLAPLKSSDGRLCFSPHEKSKVLMDTFFSGRHLKEEFFDNTFCESMNKNLRMINDLEKNENYGNEWYNREITLDELDEVLDRLRNSSSSLDDDNLHPKMIVFSGPYFRRVLITLFNRCLVTSKWPWPEARALFIKKPSKPDYTDPSAYRPLSITSHIGKIFERILNKRLTCYLMKNQLIDQEQEGFLANRNTTRSLFRLKIEHDNLKMQKKVAALINLDLEKAFDSVWQNGLLVKLWTAGIRGYLFRIIATYLKNRRLRTKIDGCYSQAFTPKQGLPQGSVVSPILFIFYIADMLETCCGVKFKYADDSQVLVAAANQKSLQHIIQRTLTSVQQWCRLWRLQINGSKTDIVLINCEAPSTRIFYLDNEKCKVKNSTKILGIIVDEKMTFKQHTEAVIGRGKNKWKELRLHCTKKWGLSRRTLVTLYRTLILPLVLYCAPVWTLANYTRLNNFQSFILRNIMETTLNPNSKAAEVLLGLPPIDILCENISAKFLTKALASTDKLQRLILENQQHLKFVTTHCNCLKNFYNNRNLKLTDPLTYTDTTSRIHILRRWNDRWNYLDFDTHLKKLVPRVEMDPMLIHATTSKQQLQIGLELLLGTCPTLNNFAYNRSLTASPLCSCGRNEETAIHFLFYCQRYENRELSAEKLDIYDLEDCLKLFTFITSSGRFALTENDITTNETPT